MTTWVYGVTTVSSRIKSKLLERTLVSLIGAGFPDPRLFIDGPFDSASAGPIIQRLEVTCHSSPLRVYGNFHLGLSELFIRNPKADLFAMFQDDFVTYRNLREYIEQIPYPSKGYLNLYTFPENEKPQEGWYPSNQLGKGAVALVFSNEAVKKLLNSGYWINRPASSPDNPKRVWKFIDGGIVETMRREGFKEYVHNPSLVQHTGIQSSLGNGRQQLAGTFKGEDFNALDLLPRVRVSKTVRPWTGPGRIGLVGHNTATGLGELNRQIAEYADVYRWLIRPHGKFKMEKLPESTDFLVCPTGVKVLDFLKLVDIVVFAEVPLYPDLIHQCKAQGKRVVCIPMMEWMPPGAKGWPRDVDLFICPTKQCYDTFAHVVPCVHFPWPVDTERFKFRQRTTCSQFLFINGHGGYKGRKGEDTIRELIRLWPEIPLVVRDQTGSSWPVPNLSKVEENYQLYDHGDVLISPHSVDGLGLEGLESMACGMPVLSTDGKPWNEIPALDRIDASIERRIVKRPVDWYLPDPEHLLGLCKKWLGQDISQQSLEARKWAESVAWNDDTAKKFNDLVRGLS